MQTVMMRFSVTIIDNGMVSYQSRPPRSSTVGISTMIIVYSSSTSTRERSSSSRGARRSARSMPVCEATVASSTSVGSLRHSQEPFSGFSICSTWPLIELKILSMSSHPPFALSYCSIAVRFQTENSLNLPFEFAANAFILCSMSPRQQPICGCAMRIWRLTYPLTTQSAASLACAVRAGRRARSPSLRNRQWRAPCCILPAPTVAAPSIGH